MNPPTMITIGGHSYLIGRLDAFQQLHVARRVGPVLMTLGVSVMDLARKAGDRETAEVLPELLGPVAGILAKMSDEEVNYVLTTCLSACLRVQGEAKARVIQSGTLMFQDIQMPEMVQLAVAVMKENLSDFFPLLAGVNLSAGASAT